MAIFRQETFNVTVDEPVFEVQVQSAIQYNVQLQGGGSIGAHGHSLSDLTQSGATVGQVPQWTGAAWVPADVSGVTVDPSNISSGGATPNQALIWNGANWVPTTLSTTIVSEGSNLYYTEARVNANANVAANTAARHTHANKAQLDLVTDGDHDVRTDNPHAVTAAQVGAAPASHTHAPADITQGGATANQVLLWNGAAWTPTSLSTSVVSEGSNLYYTEGRVSANTDVAANTAARHSHTNKAQLDLVTDGDHDVRTDNPHGVTAAQAGAAPVSHTHAPTDITQGGATSNQVLLWNGAAWTPTSLSTSVVSEGSNLYYTEARVSANTDVAANTAARHSHSNKAQLDLVTDGDHDVRTDNPHSVTLQQAYDGGGTALGREIDFTPDGFAPLFLDSANLGSAFMFYERWLSQGDLTNNGGSVMLVDTRRQLSAGADGLADDYADVVFRRDNRIALSGQTFTSTGAVVFINLQNTQTAGTLADTTTLLELGAPSAATWTGPFMKAKLSADSFPRFQINGDGSLSWGPGNLTFDTTLSRLSGNTLQAPGLDLTRGLIVNSSMGTHSLQVEGATNPYTLYTLASSNRVGVGTSTPQVALHVTGPHVSGTGTFMVGNSSDHAYMTLDHGTAVSPGKNGGLYFKQAGTAKWLIDHVQINDYLRFYDYGVGGEMIISLAGTGNIGLPHGTTPNKTTDAPAAELDLYNGKIAQMGWYRIAASASKNTTKEVIVGVTTAGITVTLDTDDVVAGRIIVVKDETGSASGSPITVATEGTQTIDGASTVSIAENYGYVKVYSDGSNWFIIGRSPTAGAP